MKKKRIGLLGGTFDPLHFGHIHLGIEMQEAHQLDSIILCPAAASPLKIEKPPTTSKEERFQMAQLAVADIPGWEVSDWELKRSGASFTIDTVRDMYSDAEKNKEKIEIFLLLGEDILDRFHLWKEVDELVTLAPPLIAVRNANKSNPVQLPLELEEICQKGKTPSRVFEVSSTLVRDRLKRKLYCGHLVPAKILDFIYQHQLYFY